MRIAMVTPWFPTEVNPSSGAFVVKDCHALAKADCDLRVIHLVPDHEDDGSRQITHEGLRVTRVPMNTNNPLDILRASRRLSEIVSHADVLHTQALSAIEPFVFSRPKIPWVHTEHWSAITSPHTLPTWQRAMLPLLLQMERLPDVVVAVCDFLAQPIRKVRGSAPVDIIPCQVPAPTTLIERPSSDGVLHLVSTGALVERKDPLIAVETLAELTRRGIAVTLTWLGDGPLRNAAIERAKTLGVQAHFPGSKSAEEVRVALAEADIFFGPTRADNFFVAAAEAIVNGRPLVVGANGGQGEYIDPAVGSTVPTQTAHAYADAIMDVAKRTKDLSARQIAQTVGDRFAPETIANQYTALYRRLQHVQTEER